MSRPFSNFSSPYKRRYRKNTTDKLRFFCVLGAVFPDSVRLFRVSLKELRKMQRIRICPWILGLICGLLSSCLEDINLDTGERILNVYCVLKQGSEQTLELSYIAPTGGTSQPVGEGVSITLYDEGTPVGQFSRTSETKWKMDYTPQGGHACRLEVKVPGEETLTAETRYPPLSPLQARVFVEEELVKDLPKMYGGFIPTGLGFEMDSPEDQYLWCYYENLDASHAFADYIATDHPGVDGRGETIYPFDPTSPVNQADFEKGRYNSAGGVFSTLILGGPVFFHEKVVRILHPAHFSRPLGDNKLGVSSSDPVAPSYAISVVDSTSLFCLAGMSRGHMEGELVINVVSAEYDSYLADFYFVNQNDDDFTHLVHKRNHYSNIQHGTGIFGACHEYRAGRYLFPGSMMYL